MSKFKKAFLAVLLGVASAAVLAVPVVVTINTDIFGGETSYALTSGGGTTILSGGPLPSSATHTNMGNIGAGDYNFTIFDSFGDGMSAGGTYSVDVGGVIVASGGGDFGSSESTNFSVAVPEPATLALFGLGLVSLGFARRRKA